MLWLILIFNVLIKQIPSLNTVERNNLQPGQLVSYTGVIQSTLEEQEIVAAFFKSDATGKWYNSRYVDAKSEQQDQDGQSTMPEMTFSDSDLLNANSSDSNLVLDERGGFCVAEIPGMSKWLCKDNLVSQPTVNVKCYAGAENTVRILDTVKVYGILQAPKVNPEEKMDGTENKSENMLTIHAIMLEKISIDDLVCPCDYEMSSARSAVLQNLQNAAGGDSLAAKMVLLTLLGSPVFNGDVIMGSISLGLYRGNKAVFESIRKQLQNLVPCLVDLPVTVESLNKQSYFPVNDGETLHTGLCQVPKHTCLLLNETALEEGRLDQKGMCFYFLFTFLLFFPFFFFFFFFFFFWCIT